MPTRFIPGLLQPLELDLLEVPEVAGQAEEVGQLGERTQGNVEISAELT